MIEEESTLDLTGGQAAPETASQEQPAEKKTPKKKAVAPAEPAKPAEPEKKAVVPKLFFKKNSEIEVAIYGYHSKETGEMSFCVPVDRSENDDNLQDLFTRVEYKFWFTPCPYDRLNRYRTRSMIYNSEDQNNTINTMRLREFFLVYHLVRWNLTDEDGSPVELKFNASKALSDESLELIYTLPAPLVDTMLITYERKLGISA